MIKYLIIWILGSFLINPAAAQDNTLEQIPVIHLGQKDGLIPNYINDMAVDSLGQLQLATFGAGIISYGGSGFFPLKSENLDRYPIIRKLKLIDHKHYFITSGELYRWDGQTDSLEIIFKDDSPIINFYKVALNKILISNYRGNYMAEYENGQFSVSKIPLLSPIIQLVQLQNNTTIAVLGDGKVITNPFGKNPKTIYITEPGGNKKIFELEEHLVLIEENSISYLDKAGYKLQSKLSIPPNVVFTVFYQDHQSIWLGSNKGIFTLKNKELQELKTYPLLSDMDISSINKTKDGTFWIGTYGNGLYKLYDHHIVKYSIDQAGLGQIYSVKRLKKSSEKFLVTSNKGLYFFENRNIIPVELPKNIKGEALFSGVDEESGNLYVGGEGFIFKKGYDRDNFKGYFHEVFDKNIITSIVPWKGNIFVGSQRGLYLFDGEFNLIRDFNEGSELKVRNVFQIHVISDNLIIYGDYYNLYETDLMSIQEFEANGLKGKVLSFTPAGNQLFWLGTSSGTVYLYDFSNHAIIKEIHSRYGKNIYSASIATDQSLVIGTEMGIERHYMDSSTLLYDERLRQYEVNYNSLAHLANGDLLVGTVGGLIKISDDYDFSPKSALWLEKFTVNNHLISLKNHRDTGKPLSLAHNENNLSFQVNLVNYKEPLHTKVRYKLLGYEDEWGPLMNIGSVQYTNLPPGEYRIMVNILYSQGDEGTFTLPLYITIRRPFWHHPLFLLGLFFSCAGVIYMGYIWFQRKTLHDNIKLQHLVDSRTKEIHQINKNLEQQVHNRTLDLHHKNQELTKTIEQKNIFQSQVRLISSNTQDIVCLLSPDYSIKIISDSIEQILGIPSADLIHLQITHLLPDGEISLSLLSYLAQLEDHSPPIILSLLHRKSKEKVLVEILGRQVLNKYTGEVQGYVLNIRNVSERELLKDEIKTVYKNIHRDFHDEVGNKLAKIIALVSVLKIQLNDFPTGTDTMGKIESTAKNLYHDTRDFIWSLDQENNKVEELSIQLRDFGQMLFDGSAIKFKCNLEIYENLHLKPNLVRDLLLIMKEVMTNVLKHSNATEVYLNIKQCGAHLVFLVKDNGIGISQNLNGKGNGMKNIQYRTRRCHGDLILKSRKGSLVGIRIKA